MGNQSSTADSSAKHPASSGKHTASQEVDQSIQVGNLKISKADILFYAQHNRPFPQLDAFMQVEWNLPRDEILRKPFNEVKDAVMKRLQLMSALEPLSSDTDLKSESADDFDLRRVDFTQSSRKSPRKSPLKKKQKTTHEQEGVKEAHGVSKSAQANKDLNSIVRTSNVNASANAFEAGACDPLDRQGTDPLDQGRKCVDSHVPHSPSPRSSQRSSSRSPRRRTIAQSEEISRRRAHSQALPRSSDHARRETVNRENRRERDMSEFATSRRSKSVERESVRKRDGTNKSSKQRSPLSLLPEQLLQRYLVCSRVVAQQRKFSAPEYWTDDEHEEWNAMHERKLDELHAIKQQLFQCIDRYQAEYDERIKLLEFMQSHHLIDETFEDAQVDKINLLEQLLKTLRHHQDS
jgi:hypothetical protein